eukprot:UN13387
MYFRSVIILVNAAFFTAEYGAVRIPILKNPYRKFSTKCLYWKRSFFSEKFFIVKKFP